MVNNDSTGDATLGCGLAFPLRLAGGRIGMNAYESQVAQSILLILRTGQGERVMRPEFGAGMEALAFEPMTPVTAALVEHRVRDALARLEPRIDVLQVSVTPDQANGTLLTSIDYRVRLTDRVGNLVYPFYVERGEA